MKKIDFSNNKKFMIKGARFSSLCANIIENARMFIGTHSAWINLFWFFGKPTICIYSDKSDWGDWMGYQVHNGCNWGFYLPWTKAIPVNVNVDMENLLALVSRYIEGFIHNGIAVR